MVKGDPKKCDRHEQNYSTKSDGKTERVRKYGQRYNMGLSWRTISPNIRV